MLKVKKFGGTSVADIEKIMKVANRCKKDYDNRCKNSFSTFCNG